jgi:hypothetical protein
MTMKIMRMKAAMSLSGFHTIVRPDSVKLGSLDVWFIEPLSFLLSEGIDTTDLDALIRKHGRRVVLLTSEMAIFKIQALVRSWVIDCGVTVAHTTPQMQAMLAGVGIPSDVMIADVIHPGTCETELDGDRISDSLLTFADMSIKKGGKVVEYIHTHPSLKSVKKFHYGGARLWNPSALSGIKSQQVLQNSGSYVHHVRPRTVLIPEELRGARLGVATTLHDVFCTTVCELVELGVPVCSVGSHPRLVDLCYPNFWKVEDAIPYIRSTMLGDEPPPRPEQYASRVRRLSNDWALSTVVETLNAVHSAVCVDTAYGGGA